MKAEQDHASLPKCHLLVLTVSYSFQTLPEAVEMHTAAKYLDLCRGKKHHAAYLEENFGQAELQ